MIPRSLSNLLLPLLALTYFSLLLVAPSLSAHRSPDLAIISAVFVLLLLRARDRCGPIQSEKPPFGTQTALLLAALLLLSLSVRIYDLNYNVPFIDELLNFEISSIGNANFIAADSRLWGVLCRLAYDLGGLEGARAANALLGTLCVLAVFFLAHGLYRFAGVSGSGRFGALVASAAFSFSTPTIFVSVLATHDALSLLFFISGLSLLIAGLNTNRNNLLIHAAFLIFLSFAARFFIFVMFPTIALFSHGPFKLLSREQKRLAERWFYLPLILFGGIYFLFDCYHIYTTVSLGARLSSAVSERSFSLVTNALALFVLPIALGLVLSVTLGVLFRVQALPRQPRLRSLALYFLCSALILPAVQLAKCSDFGSEKNLSYAVLFAALLFGLLLEQYATTWRLQPRRALAMAVSGLVLFLWGMTSGVSYVLPRGIRSEHLNARKAAEVRLAANPVIGALTVPLQITKQRWLSPAPVLSELRRLGLDAQEISVFGLYGGEHVSWYLTHYLGRNPQTRRYYVDQEATWVKDFFSHVRDQRIPVLIAVLPEIEPFPFERMFNHHGYQFVSHAQIEEVEGPYGRQFIIVNPQFLNRGKLHGAERSYFEAILNYSEDLPNAAARTNRRQVSEIFNDADSTLRATQDSWKKISLLLEQAKARAVIGEGERSAQSLNYARNLGITNLGPGQVRQQRFLAYLGQQANFMPSYRTKVLPENEPRIAENLVSRATLGTTTPAEAAKTNGRAYWLDFEPPLQLIPGVSLRIDVTLKHSKMAGLRLVEKDQDFSARGYMELLPFAEGRQVIFVPINTERQLSRIDVQVGPEAWGVLGGSILGELEFNSVSIEQREARELYLGDRRAAESLQ